MKKVITTSVLSFFIISCASTLVMDSSINEFLLMGIKTNSKDNVVFNFKSNVVDGKHIPFNKGKIPYTLEPWSFKHNESYTLNRMTQEYLSMRFLNLGKSGEVVINLTLNDFWVEQWDPGSVGERVGEGLLAVLSGVDVSKFEVEAHIDASITVTKDGKTETKIIKTSHSEQTNDRSGAMWQKGISVCLNKVNNKLLMAMSQFLETLEL